MGKEMKTSEELEVMIKHSFIPVENILLEINKKISDLELRVDLISSGQWIPPSSNPDNDRF